LWLDAQADGFCSDSPIFSPRQGISAGLTVSSVRRMRVDDVAPMEGPS
jgi:hypothetical protein